MKDLIIVIGRGNSGTRLISSTLSESGVFMGSVNESGDMVPAEKMYEAVRLAGDFVSIKSELSWDFSKLCSEPVPEKFMKGVREYAEQLARSTKTLTGWKLPETVLALPWIIKMFPDAHYIYWTRDPRDSIAGRHITDDLRSFNVQVGSSLPFLIRESLIDNKRLESWIYQKNMMDETPKPKKLLEIKFEDFVLNQDNEINRLEDFLKIPIAKVPVDGSKVGRFKDAGIIVDKKILDRYGYK
jgi:hypothetical protein